MVMTLGEVDCDTPCGTCGRCRFCADITGTQKLLMTFSDVTEQSDPNPADACTGCNALLNVTHDLTLLSVVDSDAIFTLLTTIIAAGCGLPTDFPADVADVCTFAKEIPICGNPAIFTYEAKLAVFKYVDSGGDLRALSVFYANYVDAITPANSTLALSTDDFLLVASPATSIDCLSLNYDGTLVICAGGEPTYWCTVPVAYNLQAAAA